MEKSVNKVKYRWISHAVILSVIVMAFYTFIGSIIIEHITLNDQLFFSIGGFFNSHGLYWVLPIAYIFWLTLILGIYMMSRVEKTGSKMKVILIPFLISVFLTLTSFGLSILTGGPSQSVIFMGAPFWYYNVNIIRLPLHISSTGAFYSYRLAFDLLFWYLAFFTLWMVYGHVKVRKVPLAKTE